MKPKVSIIIVNYNTEKEIDKCLKSIQHSAWRQDLSASQRSIQHLETIVVDNASTDNSVEVIQKFPQVKLIQNKNNLGFAKAVNQGLKVAKGEFLFFLNPDCELKRDTILRLLDFAKKNPNSIVGPKILNSDGTIQGSCYNLPTVWGAVKEYWFGKKGVYEKFAPLGVEPLKVEAIVGAAMFMPKKVFEKLGGFDERYFLYYEDLDFCRKAAKLKIPVYYFPQATITHSLGKAGGNLEHLKKSAQIYHGALIYFLITLIIKTSRWLKF